MTKQNKQRLLTALENAAEMIRGHIETGLEPDDVNEIDQKGLEQYGAACERAFKMITTLSKKYRQ